MRTLHLWPALLGLVFFYIPAVGQVPRCEVVPLPEQQVSMRVNGIERLRWHFGEEYERPFFFPFCGPGGPELTRMGHPGAPNHDHHRSIWFAHANIEGTDFWSNTGQGRIRQLHWYVYEDGEQEARMALRLGWFDGGGRLLMESDLVTELKPLEGGESVLALQLTCRAPAGRESVTLGRTNFGLLAVRVAKSMSVHFGDGTIKDSEGRIGEAAIFGEPARWVDYSGSVAVGTGAQQRTETQGITYFDHPENPSYPSRWHVREDGWMGASVCREAALTITRETPLTFRYLLYAHSGGYDAVRAAALAKAFELQPRMTVRASKAPHQQYELVVEEAGE